MNRSAVFFVVLSLAATSIFAQSTRPVDGAPQSTNATAVWKPVGAFDPLERQVRLADALVDRGLAELALEELAEISDEELQNAAPSNRAFYGVASIRATLETARLTSPEDRGNVAQALESIREKLDVAVGAETAGFELALVRAYYALGVLAAESGNEPESARYLDLATSAARNAVGALPNGVAKPFLYWHAKATLVRRDDPNRFAQAEKVAAALERSSAATRDEYYFYARLLLIESAREQGELDLASKRIAETLDALSARANDPDAPVEFAVGLLAEEAKTLAAEGKLDEAVRTAAQNVDLLDAPLPPNRGRYVDKALDLFEDLDLTRVETFWSAAKNAPEEKDDDVPTNLPNKQTLVEAARLAASELRSNFRRARASLLANAAGQESGDWFAMQAAAEENYRIGAWLDAVDGYDRAAQAAEASGAIDDAFRLRGVAASVVDKVCREKRFDETDRLDPKEWETDARRRFEELARKNPDDKLAPSFFLLALEHAQNAGESEDALNALRLEYLELFPNANDRGERALDLARRFLAKTDYDAAQIALDAIAPDDPVLPDALEVERALHNARFARERDVNALVATVERLLRKTSAAPTGSVATLDDASAALTDFAQSLSSSSLSDADALVLDLIVELALNDDARKDAKFAAALDDLLDVWEQNASDKSTLAKIRSYRLSLAVDTKTPQEIVAIFNTLDGASSSAALDALDRLVEFADRAQGDTRKRLAQFSLDSTSEISVDKGDADRVAIVQADALRLLGRSQESLNLYAKLLKKDSKNARVLKGLATILTTQTDAKALDLAVKYWSDYADLNPDASPEWWNAKEKCVEIYCKTGKKDQAEKMLKTLWLTRTDPSDPNRKARWEKTIEAAR